MLIVWDRTDLPFPLPPPPPEAAPPPPPHPLKLMSVTQLLKLVKPKKCCALSSSGEIKVNQYF